MITHKFMNITKGGVYNNNIRVETFQSYKRQNDVGVRIEIPKNEVVEFKYLDIRNTGLPIRHISGGLIVQTLVAVDFTADLFNSPGNLTIDNLIVEVDGSNFSRADYRKYHVDALGQFFSKNKNVTNVTINNIEAVITGKLIQGMMLSEGDNDYSNFSIGRGNVEIQIDYPYAFNANQLRDSYINVGDNGIIIKNRKDSNYNTQNVIVKKYSKLQDIIIDSRSIYYA